MIGSPKVGGIALIIGSIFTVIGNILHPFPGGVSTPESFAQFISDNIGVWIPAHTFLLLGFPILGLGFLTLYGVLKEKDEGIFALLAVFALGITTLFGILVTVIDGFVDPILAEKFLAASADARQSAATILDFSGVLTLHLIGLTFGALTVGLTLFGASLIKAKLYNRAFAIAGLGLGLFGVVGYLAGIFGPFFVLSPVFPPYAAIFTIWFLVLGVFVYRGR